MLESSGRVSRTVSNLVASRPDRCGAHGRATLHPENGYTRVAGAVLPCQVPPACGARCCQASRDQPASLRWPFAGRLPHYKPILWPALEKLTVRAGW